jgi:hypothetical protein
MLSNIFLLISCTYGKEGFKIAPPYSKFNVSHISYKSVYLCKKILPTYMYVTSTKQYKRLEVLTASAYYKPFTVKKVSDISAGDGKIANLFYSVAYFRKKKLSHTHTYLAYYMKDKRYIM